MKYEPCYLLKQHIIPPEEVNRVFTESYSASGDMGSTFLCFDEPYQAAACAADKDSIILDFGCAYAPQSYYFTHCARYIGVDLPLPAPQNYARAFCDGHFFSIISDFDNDKVWELLEKREDFEEER